MRIKILSAEVHNQIFADGKNLGLKLGKGSKCPQVELEYDLKLQCLIVRSGAVVILVPAPTVASMHLADPTDIEAKRPAVNLVP